MENCRLITLLLAGYDTTTIQNKVGERKAEILTLQKVDYFSNDWQYISGEKGQSDLDYFSFSLLSL